jgi:Transcription factor WhiB
LECPESYGSGRSGPFDRDRVAPAVPDIADGSVDRPLECRCGGHSPCHGAPVPLPAMNEALVHWLMAPDAPDERLTHEDWLRRPAWHQRAACRGVGPTDYVRGPKADYETIGGLCTDCPVRRERLAVALANPDLMGLWGGTTEVERREIRRGRVA